MILQPLLGMLSDRVGRRPMLITFGLAFTILPVPLLGMLTNSFSSLLFIQCLGMIFLGCFTSVSAAVNSELFPTRVRAAGPGFPYSLTVAIFGGTAPLIGTALKDAGDCGPVPVVHVGARPGLHAGVRLRAEGDQGPAAQLVADRFAGASPQLLDVVVGGARPLGGVGQDAQVAGGGQAALIAVEDVEPGQDCSPSSVCTRSRTLW